MKIYAIASRLNGDEFLTCGQNGMLCEPLVYQKSEQVTDLLFPFYDVLPQGPEHRDFYRLFETLANFYPVVVALEVKTALNTIVNSMEIIGTFTSAISVLPFPHVLIKMKPGFIERYEHLDVLKHIEAIQSVDADGRIRLNMFEVVHSHKGEKSRMPLANEETLNALRRKRGLL